MLVKEEQKLKQYVRSVGYNKNSKVATLSLNFTNNKYCCSRCGTGGFSIGLYAKMRHIDNKKAYRELLDKECFSMNKSYIEISPINELADIETRDKVYRDFLNMLKLNTRHRKELEKMGFLNSDIEEKMYRTIPKDNILRRLIGNKLKRKYGDLSGIPGFYQNEDLVWNFTAPRGFFIPVFDEGKRIQALSMHLDKEFNGTKDLWFSSKGKINGTAIKNIVVKYNITEDTDTVVLTDNFLLGNYIKESLNVPIIAFSNISNSYQILKIIDNTNIQNILFTFKVGTNDNLDYIINRIFRDLIPLGYELEVKAITDFKEVLKDDFLTFYRLKKVA